MVVPDPRRGAEVGVPEASALTRRRLIGRLAAVGGSAPVITSALASGAWAQEATPSGTPVAPGSPTPTSGGLVYLADTTGGLDEWPLPDPEDDASWSHADGMLINDGSVVRPDQMKGRFLEAPYRPRVADYAVEAEIRITGEFGDTIWLGCGLAARVGQGAYWAGLAFIPGQPPAYIGGEQSSARGHSTLGPPPFQDAPARNRIAAADLDLTWLGAMIGEWHSYRFEVDGDALRLLIDGRLVAEGADDRFHNPGRVGVWSSGIELEVRRFAVIALSMVEAWAPTAAEMEAASADAFTALEFAHRYGDRFPELSNAVIRRAVERDWPTSTARRRRWHRDTLGPPSSFLGHPPAPQLPFGACH